MYLKFVSAPDGNTRVLEARDYRTVATPNRTDVHIAAHTGDGEILCVISKNPEDWNVCYVTGADGKTIDVIR